MPEWCPRVHREQDRPFDRNAQCDFLIRSRARRADLCEPLCPYQKPTWWSKEVLFAFTHACTTRQEEKGPKEFYVDPEKFHYTCLTFDIPNEERRDALALFTWLAHELSTPEREDESYDVEDPEED